MDISRLLVCPAGHASMEPERGGDSIVCRECGSSYAIVGGVPVLFDAEKAGAHERLQKEFYETLYRDASCCLDPDSVQRGREEKSSAESPINRIWRDIRDFYAGSASGAEVAEDFTGQFGLRGGETVLEIGCGIGTPGTSWCLENKERIYYVGLDLTLAPLLRLKRVFDGRGAKQFSLINADILGGSLRPESFDIVFGRGILHHFDTRAKTVLASCIRSLLKPGGKAFFLEPLNTSPLMKLLRSASKPFRPNLAWEFPFSSKELQDFTAAFDRHEIHYHEAFSMFSLSLAFSPKLYQSANGALRELDRALRGAPFGDRLFTRAVIVVRRN